MRGHVGAKPTTLYFLVMRGQRRWLKVGIAMSLKRRLRDYKSGIPIPVRVIHSREFPDRYAARMWEATILFWFRLKRPYQTEWIEIDDEVRGFLKRLRAGENMELPIYEGAARMATRPCDKYYRENLLNMCAQIRDRNLRRAA